MKNAEGNRKASWEEQWGTLRELVNLPDRPETVKKFSREHPGYAGRFSLRIAKMLLQKAWLGGEDASRAATTLLSGQFALGTMSDETQNRIVRGAEARITEDAARFLSPIHADWFRGELVHQWISPLEQDFYNLLRISDHALRCKRYGRGCPEPYFVAKKLPRNYCGAECSQKAQQESKEKYEKQRQTRKEQQSKRRREK